VTGADSTPMTGELWLARHGDTEWTVTGRHTSRTEVQLTPAGRAAARHLAGHLAGRAFALVLVSPRQRARQTAELAGFPDAEIDPNLAEWDYGELEGLTTEEIRGRGPAWAEWTIWDGPVPGGEDIERVAARAGAVVARADAVSGDVLCFAHGHLLRVLTAVALSCPPEVGARLALDPAALNVIGNERETRVLRTGNAFVL
jgi:probable phosphoglycerate mutase